MTHSNSLVSYELSVTSIHFNNYTQYTYIICKNKQFKNERESRVISCGHILLFIFVCNIIHLKYEQFEYQ